MPEQAELVATPVEPKEEILARIRESERLPSVPHVAVKIIHASRDENVDIDELTAILSSDPALTAWILRLANSSMFSRRTPTASIRAALVRLGLKITRIAVLGFVLAEEFKNRVPPVFNFDYFWRHALTTAAAASTICEAISWPGRDEAFASGLLQDIGVLTLHCVMPEQYAEVLQEQKRSPTVELFQIEGRRLGITHTEAGAALLRRWQLPEEIHAPVLYHHEPEQAKRDGKGAEALAMASVLRMGGIVARLFCDAAKGVTHRLVENLALREFRIPEGETASLLEKVCDRVRDLVDAFRVDRQSIPPYLEIQAQANRELSRFALTAELGREKDEVESQVNRKRVLELEEENHILKEQATVDWLTGLLNRREVVDRLRLELARSRRYGDNMGFLLLDVDHFKVVNDSYGHQVGDQALSRLGMYLASTLRQNDVAGRYGGDEFVIIQPKPDIDGVLLLAERLRLGIEQESRTWVEGCPGITVSIGAVHAGGSSLRLEVDSLIATVDRCLYAAKEGGRNCTRYAVV